MGDEPADDRDDESDTTNSFVWEAISEDNDTAEQSVEGPPGTEESQEESNQSPVADGTRESPGPEGDSEEDTETATADLEQLIAEDPTGAGPDEKDTERTESKQPNASASEERADQSGSVGNGPTKSDPGSGSSGRSGTGEKSDRLWNRFGSEGDSQESQSRTGPDEARDDTGEAAGTGSDGQTDRAETANRVSEGSDRQAKRDSEESGETHGNAQGRADEAETTAADSDRLWNQRDPDTSQSPSADPDSSDDAQAGGGTAPSEATEASESRTSFDHLLERSESGAGNPRPVGSPTVETDLDAFFSDLEEFDRATSGSQVLVISPRGHSIGDDVCSQFLTAGGVSGRNAMFVTAVDPPEDRIEICRSNDDWTGGKVAVIELGDTGSDSDGALGQVGGEEVVRKRVNSPKNLSKTGLLITQTLKKWASSDQPSILCFHTLTAVGGYVENETLFQFLFTLQAKLNSLGVTGHYHMDANKHDQQEINTLKTLFDLVITISRNGEIEVE